MGVVDAMRWENLEPSVKARLKARASHDSKFVAGLSAGMMEDIKRDRSHPVRKDVVKHYIKSARASGEWKELVRKDCYELLKADLKAEMRNDANFMEGLEREIYEDIMDKNEEEWKDEACCDLREKYDDEIKTRFYDQLMARDYCGESSDDGCERAVIELSAVLTGVVDVQLTEEQRTRLGDEVRKLCRVVKPKSPPAECPLRQFEIAEYEGQLAAVSCSDGGSGIPEALLDMVDALEEVDDDEFP